MEEQLSNKIFELKEKITDREFKDLMETLQGVYKEKKEKEFVLYEIEYIFTQLTMRGRSIETELVKKKAIIKLSCAEDFDYAEGKIETEKHFLNRVESRGGVIFVNNSWSPPPLRNFHQNLNGYCWCEVCSDNCCGECGESNTLPVDFECPVKNSHIFIHSMIKLS
jgi:hypothetical protein